MKSSFKDQLRNYLELSKPKIMVPVSLTGFTGYFTYYPHISYHGLLVTLAILLLSVSATVLNQVQEIKFDSLMLRTRERPLPSKRITPPQALLFCFCCLFAGALIIYATGGLKSLLTGLLTILWYNGIYTYAKRITAFAVVPGAVTGALPPLIGWVAAGGGIWDKPIIFIGFLFFVGQIPHFWLLLMRYGKEYEAAGLPSLTRILSGKQINRLTFTWVVTSVIAALFLCYFEIIRNGTLTIVLLVASVILVWTFSGLVRSGNNNGKNRKYSAFLYSYYLLLIILLISDSIIA